MSTTEAADVAEVTEVDVPEVTEAAGVDDEHQCRNKYGYVPKERLSVKSKLKQNVQCSGSCFLGFLLGLFPIIQWLPKYSPKRDLAGDIIGGLTTAVVRIPQSMAYGLLAGAQPINGLYTAFLTPLTYGFLGTSIHVSMGTFAIVSLMMEAALEEYEAVYPPPFVSPPDGDVISLVARQTLVDMAVGNGSGTVMTTSMTSLANASTASATSLMSTTEAAAVLTNDEIRIAYRLTIISALTCLVGVIEVVLGFMKLGFIAVFLSDPLVSGFTCASAFHVFTSQIKACFGLKVPRQAAPFTLIKTWIELAKKLPQANTTTIVISVIAIACLYPVKIINQKYKKQLRSIPIPIELFVVVIATIISSYMDLSGVNSVETVGRVAKGLPSPIIPDPTLWPRLFSSAISMAIVAYAMTVSLGKLFAQKHDYTISPNQEFFALGASQVVCAFFQGHVGSASLSRTAVKESSGVRTQMANFVSCAVLLLVLLLIGPYLSSLPTTCLSCIIIVNLRSLFRQFTQLPRLWRLSKADFLVWVVTFLGTFLMGVDTGLFIGIGFLLASVVVRMYHPNISAQGQLGDTGVYRNVDKFSEAQQIAKIKVIRYSQSPFFANKESIQKMMVDLLREIKSARKNTNAQQNNGEENPALTADEGKNANAKETEFIESNLESENNEATADAERPSEDESGYDTIVFDCSGWTMMDIVGMEAVKQLCRQVGENGVKVSFASLQGSMVNKLIEIGVVENCDGSGSDESTEKLDIQARVYPNIYSAVQAASV